MNWYKIYKIAQIQGEFWIDDSGNVMSADGDIGPYNHESYVIESIQHRYVPDGYGEGEFVDWEGGLQALAEEKAQEMIDELDDKVDEYTESPGEIKIKEELDMNPDTFWTQALKEEGMTDEEYDIAFGSGDARLFAMKNWAWKRLVSTDVETYTLTPRDISIIASGLYEAYNESVEQAVFNIYVYANKTWYNDVPYDVIERGKPIEFRQYNSTFVGMA